MLSQDLQAAVKLLQHGECVAIPTETVYGLAADATSASAVAKIFTIKNRPTFDPLIVHLAESADVFKWVTDFPEKAKKLADHFWPGPLTLILPKNNLIPDLVTSGLPNVGIRVPEHPLAREILRQFGKPLAAPSANQFGRISPTTAQDVEKELGGSVSLILDGGACRVGIESTIVAFPEGNPTILRLGGISQERIEEVIGKVALENRPHARPQAPGQLAEHYAPRKPLRLIKTLLELKQLETAENGILYWGEHLVGGFGKSLNLSERKNWTEAATNFFKMLREMDESNVEKIVALELPEEGIARAINERLRRASHQ